MSIKHFYSKIAGISRQNSDGTSRQAIAAQCEVGEGLYFEHEPDNPVDPNAIKLSRLSGEQLGYLRADYAERLIREAERGYQYVINVTDITGGGPGRNFGINIMVIVATPGVSQDEIQEFARKAFAGEVFDPAYEVTAHDPRQPQDTLPPQPVAPQQDTPPGDPVIPRIAQSVAKGSGAIVAGAKSIGRAIASILQR